MPFSMSLVLSHVIVHETNSEAYINVLWTNEAHIPKFGRPQPKIINLTKMHEKMSTVIPLILT